MRYTASFVLLISILLLGLFILITAVNNHNDSQCKQQYGNQYTGRLGSYGSPECISDDGVGKYLK